ncbi:hypothetical protein FBU59_000378 [Linderina macrospora]|uniref:Uncharacterized protein n=1 Tax=Linderina macrospora TaxID=4868 RepID=A0ACC1JH90_9FUNG|nr:hypothetical protein FBU59_000378 [Linderina macrospora]
MTLPEQPTQPGQIPRREFTKEQFAQLVSRAGEFTPEQKAQFMAQMNISLGQLLPVVPEGLFTGAYALGLENANGLIALYSNWHLLNPHAKRFLELAMEPLSSSAHTTAPQPQSLVCIYILLQLEERCHRFGVHSFHVAHC